MLVGGLNPGLLPRLSAGPGVGVSRKEIGRGRIPVDKNEIFTQVIIWPRCLPTK